MDTAQPIDDGETAHFHCARCPTDAVMHFPGLAGIAPDMGERTFRAYAAYQVRETIRAFGARNTCPNCGGNAFVPTLPVVLCGVEVVPSAA